MNTQRASSAFTRYLPRLAYPLAVIATLWIVAGRSLFGAGGDLVPVFAVSFGPMLLVAMGMGAVMMRREAALHVTRSTTFTIALVYVISFVLALVFGFLVPDRMGGRVVSAASQVFGEWFVGLSAGFGNTAGILTLCFALATYFLALNESKKTHRTLAGIDPEQEEERERASYTYDFLD
ncbi:hypothetical protein [Rothia sp. ZJ1223]|uniref:hypothetical protein n=1 Tax=Rothia sp. ZJ1223 TaxID=2811098 RepID=UPI001959A770|nr:hypothetical protein [Rothia sp. ZJ1223]MBM7052015.1 hypothetical protein [Rothia sp. ZJ1223]